MDRDDMIHAAWAMERFGSGFAQALAQLIYKADKGNSDLILDTWPLMIGEYLNLYHQRMANG